MHKFRSTKSIQVNRRVLVALVLVLVTALALTSSVSAHGENLVNAVGPGVLAVRKDLARLNLEILHRALALERSNVIFLIHSHPEMRFKPLRYFLFQETGASLIESGLIKAVADRRHQEIHGGKVSGVMLENSLTPQMVGQLINACGDVVELSFNARYAHKNRKDHFDPDEAKRAAIRLHDELDRLLVAREAFLTIQKSLSADELRIALAEGRVMRAEEKLIWLQYSRSLMEARKFSVFENTFYLFDIAKNITGASGNMVGLIATHWAEPRLNIGANILTTLSGAIAMTNPIVSRFSGRVGAYLQGNQLDRNYNSQITGVVSRLLDDEEQFRLAVAEQGVESFRSDRILFDRIAVYERELERATEGAQNLRKAARRANTSSLGKVSIGFLAGGSKVASGVAGIVAADRLGARAAAPLLLGGATAYAAGIGLTLADNLKLNLKRQIKFEHDRQNHVLPRDLLRQDLNEIGKLDIRLSKSEGLLDTDY